MEMHPTITIGVDADGGDKGTGVVVEGIEKALQQFSDIEIRVFSQEDLGWLERKHPGRVEFVPAGPAITMHDPATIIRNRPDCSIVMACDDETVQAVYSIGNSGATFAAASIRFGKIKGIKRAALASVIPGNNHFIFLDMGVNTVCKPNWLVQFALMGQAYAEIALAKKEPSIGLLNIGKEMGKGTPLTEEAEKLLMAVPGFIGNIEGDHLLEGLADVIVTDGFTGNVALKLMEGTSSFVQSEVRAVMTASPVKWFFALIYKRSFGLLKKKISKELYGGAPILGLEGTCLIGHGSSGPEAVYNGIRIAAECVRQDLPNEIKKRLPS